MKLSEFGIDPQRQPAASEQREPSQPREKRTLRHWTTAETAVLRQIYPTGGVQAVLEHLPHRTECAIRMRVKQLRLRSNYKGRPRGPINPWTTEELLILKTEYPLGGIARVRPLLPGRTDTNIYQMCHRKGIRRLPE